MGENKDYMSYRCAKLFCENCGISLGIHDHDIVCANLESIMYCKDCVKKYIEVTPINLKYGTIVTDCGNSVQIKYYNNYYNEMIVTKLII